jgi:LmbE family N-acetylglucosaminyl deacetylase
VRPGTPVTILAPHLDDAVLSCWSVVDSAADVRVVTLFAGIPAPGEVGWWDRRTGADDSAARMRERRREDVEALATARREGVQLDFLDEQYRQGEAIATADLLAAVEPHLHGRTVYGPAGIGLHADHLLARSLLAALGDAGIDRRLYADLPYCARYGWPGWVTGAAPRRDADADWESALSGFDVAGLAPRPRRLDTDAQARKLRALESYRSQFAALTVGADRHVADPGVLPFEVLWEAPGDGTPSSAASRT